MNFPQKPDMTDQEEDDTWEEDPEANQSEPPDDVNNDEMKPVWITDSKNNIKFAITHVNYSQVG